MLCLITPEIFSCGVTSDPHKVGELWGNNFNLYFKNSKYKIAIFIEILFYLIFTFCALFQGVKFIKANIISHHMYSQQGFPGGTSGKEPTCQCRRHKRQGFDPWVEKLLWRRASQPTPVFLPGESHGQRSLAGYSAQGCTELIMIEATQHTHIYS